MGQIGSDLRGGGPVPPAALHTQSNRGFGVAERRDNGKSEKEHREGVDSTYRRQGNWIAFGQARLDGRRLVNGLLGRVVLRQAAMHDPAEDGQHDDKETHAEASPDRPSSGVDPGAQLPRCLVVVHVRPQNHLTFRCGLNDFR